MLLFYLVVSTLNALVAILPALVIKRLIDHTLPARDAGELTALAAALAGIYIANTALNLGAAYVGERIALGIILNLRLALFDHLQRMPLAFFTRTQTGMLQSRLNNDVGEVNSFFTQTASSTVTDLLSIAFTLAAMLALSPLVTLFVCLLIPVLLVPAEYVARRSRVLNRLQMKRWGAMNATTAERFNVAGALLVKLFGRYDRELRAFAERVTLIRNTAIQTEMLSTLFGSALGLAGSLAVVAIYFVGGRSSGFTRRPSTWPTRASSWPPAWSPSSASSKCWTLPTPSRSGPAPGIWSTRAARSSWRTSGSATQHPSATRSLRWRRKSPARRARTGSCRQSPRIGSCGAFRCARSPAP